MVTAPDSDVVKIAVFDLDGTLIRGQSQFLFVQHMRRAGVLTQRDCLRLGTWLIGYRLGIVQDVLGIRRRFFRMFRDMPYALLNSMAEDFVRQVLQYRIRREALTEMRRLKMSGHKVVLVSAALAPLVVPVARLIRSDGCIATRLEVVDGHATGEMDGGVNQGEQKRSAFAEYADRHYPNWVLASVYSDHEEDLPLLEYARSAVPVNPTRRLRKIADERAWPCVYWR